MSNITRRDCIKALAALTSVTVASQFDGQLEAMARALSGPQEWVLSIDEPGLRKLASERLRLGNVVMTESGRATAECTFEISSSDLWALAALTDPDGNEWRTADGESWAWGDRRMIL